MYATIIDMVKHLVFNGRALVEYKDVVLPNKEI